MNPKNKKLRDEAMVDETKLRHILDYDTLQEWGFVWASVRDGDVVDSYLIPETTGSDAHNFNPILLRVYPHHNFITHWIMQYLGAESPIDTLFRGIIRSKEDLEAILKCCVVFKFNKK